MWTLIIIAVVGYNPTRGVSIDHVSGFTSQNACITARKVLLTTNRNTKSMVTTCVAMSDNKETK